MTEFLNGRSSRGGGTAVYLTERSRGGRADKNPACESQDRQKCSSSDGTRPPPRPQAPTLPRPGCYYPELDIGDSGRSLPGWNTSMQGSLRPRRSKRCASASSVRSRLRG